MDDDYRRRVLRAARDELVDMGMTILEENGSGLLTSIMPGELEGHFRVDVEGEGWRIWGTFGDGEIRVDGAVSANAMASLVAETLLDWRARYCREFGRPTPPVLPPPRVRRMKKDVIAEQLVADIVGGTLAKVNNAGFDVLDRDGSRIQVKSSVRNARSKLISTLQFHSDVSYTEHDQLIYIEMTPFHFPVRGWRIDSSLFRQHIPDDRKTHQVEPLLEAFADDITASLQAAFNDRYLR